VFETLSRNEFIPKDGNGSPVPDTPRNRCLEFIKNLVKWENSNDPDYIVPARKLIAAAHKFLHPGADGGAPKVLDPFAGGGAIPLEALRLGCEAHAIDLNPVAHLIELCTLVYPQKFGQPDSRLVPDYIKRLIAHNRVKKKAKGIDRPLLDQRHAAVETVDGEIFPDVEITESEYRKNPLATDVKYWGYWAYESLATAGNTRYVDPHADERPLAYLWARSVVCPNPTCKARIPLLRQLWLCHKPRRKIALKPIFDSESKTTTFAIVEGSHIDFDPTDGTVSDGKAQCPFCSTVADGSYLRDKARSGQMGQQMTAVVALDLRGGKQYRCSTALDVARFEQAKHELTRLANDLPSEPIPQDRPSPNSRGLSGVARYGFETFGDMFNARQAVLLLTLVDLVHLVSNRITTMSGDTPYAKAIAAYLAFATDKVADFSSTFCRWGNDDEGVTGTFGMQAVGMVWDYAETNPLCDKTGGFRWAIDLVVNAIKTTAQSHTNAAHVKRGSASRLPFGDSTLDAVIVDPPYYDSVPYGDLSDYFYVWLKRSLGGLFGEVFSTPLTPKADEAIAYWGNAAKKRAIQKPPEWYEQQIALCFAEMNRSMSQHGVASIMFAHKTTTAWEAIVSALGRSGMYCTASWPIHTEGRGRLTSQDAAALASSITLVCRKRDTNAESGLWDDVRQELKTVAQERLDFFWPPQQNSWVNSGSGSLPSV
jgi:adenine-specific DNA methylase